jgi:probable HAF family extracellular repeat protein
MNPFVRRAGALLAFVFLSSASAKPVLHIIRPIRGTEFTMPADVSADGRALALHSEKANSVFQAFRQVRPNRPKAIPMNLPVDSVANAISADGSVVVGWTYNAADATRGYRWTKETGTVDLSSDPDLIYFCSSVSSDGHVAIGSFQRTNLFQPFFWSADTGLQPLNLSGNDLGYAYGANHDGSVIVGIVGTLKGTHTNFACRWLKMGQVELLDPSARNSYAGAVTPDGSIIVGGSSAGRAFYWTRSFGIQWIEPGATHHFVNFADVSADARRIVGYGRKDFNVTTGILWTKDEGLQDLNELFGSLLPRGWRFAIAGNISADGRWIAGTLEGPNDAVRGYLLDMGRRK